MFNYMSTCKFCDSPVAKGAKTCVHCGGKKPSRGRAITGEPSVSTGTTILIILIVIVGSMVWNSI